MSNLFKQIWYKNFKKGENPEKLADDLGPLRGFVNIKKYDPNTGKIIEDLGQHNTLVNQSKSSLIRLISQGQSIWRGQIDPTQLKISRMRFGNNDPGATLPSKLLYYKITEPSARGSYPLIDGTGNKHAGGLQDNVKIDPDPSSIIINSTANVSGNYTLGSTSNLKIYTIRNSNSGGDPLVDNPPSHGTFKIELLNSSVVVETIYFYNTSDPTSIIIYPRIALNPYKIATLNGNTPANRILAPNSRPTNDGSSIWSKLIVVGDNSKTFLYYDYTAQVWKIQLEELSGTNTLYDTVRLSYERGTYNVINSIIPRDGYNVGTGGTIALRYSGNTAGDYYPILSTIEYRDGDTDFVDDYSVTFSVNISGQYGNGTLTNMAKHIRYKEAYLFNELDEMFSALFLTTSFDKNQLAAYYVSWTILSPI